MHASSQKLRVADGSLSDEEAAVEDLFAGFFAREVSEDLVRSAEATGFDAVLWKRLHGLGVPMMGVAEERGGGGAGLVELCLASEHLGRSIAPVPLVETCVAARAVSRAGHAGDRLLEEIASGERLVVPALRPTTAGTELLIAGAPVAHTILGLHDGTFVAVSPGERAPHLQNLGSVPLARIMLGDGHDRCTLAEGDDAHAIHAAAVTEWRLLTAAALTGLAQTALDSGIRYANERHAFGVPIGSFQAISHPLVDVGVDVDAARTLVRRAAWFLDNEPEPGSVAVEKAFIHAARTAHRATTVSVHTHGGVGITLESDQQLLFRRAKGWACLAGDPTSSLDRIGDELASRS